MTEPTQEQFYDSYWGETEDQRIYGPVARHTRRLIVKIIANLDFETVADIGCGEGTLLRELLMIKPGLKATGTDISPLAVRLSARKNPGLDFKVLDLEHNALPNTFDLVLCTEVIEHIRDHRSAIRHLAAMTGRYLVITTLGGRMRRHEPDLGHQRNYDPGALREIVAEAGLKPVRLIQWGWPFFSPFYRNLLEILTSQNRKLVTGSFSASQKLAAHMLYALFLLNSEDAGDQLVLLAARP